MFDIQYTDKLIDLWEPCLPILDDDDDDELTSCTHTHRGLHLMPS